MTWRQPRPSSKPFRKLIPSPRSALCSVIYNIAEVDFPERWSTSVQEVADRLKAQSEPAVISGLMALKQIFQANEFGIDEERDSLNHLVDAFFPLLEQIMAQIAQSSSENQILMMHLIAKIFYSANNVISA